MEKDELIDILFLCVGIIVIYYSVNYFRSEAVYHRSKLDNIEYLVQNLDKKEEASYILSVIHQRIILLKNYLHKEKDNHLDFAPYIEQFQERIKNVVLMESPTDGNYTSYTVNKGEEISLCLRSKKTGNFHDLNLIMYVVLHELAHVACPEIDHTDLFKKIFIFFIETSSKIGIYKIINYQLNPHEYCGITINENLV